MATTRGKKRGLEDGPAPVSPANPAKVARTQNYKASKTGSVQPKHRFADKGDVIFSVGGVRENVRFLVSSAILSVASKYYAALFSARFLEGQSLSVDSPPTIDFPEDDPDHFEFLLGILHFQDVVPFEADEHELITPMHEAYLVDVLILADKYDCTRPVRSHIAILAREAAAQHAWNRKHEPLDYDQTELFEALLDSLTIAYVVGDQEQFWRAGRCLLVHTGPLESLTQASSRSSAHLLPAAIWTYLSEQRAIARAYAMTRLRDIVGKAKHLLVYGSLATEFGTEGQKIPPEKLLTICDTDGISIGVIVEHMLQDFRKSPRLYTDKIAAKSAEAVGNDSIMKNDHMLQHIGGPCLKCVKKGEYKADFWKTGGACDHARKCNFGMRQCLSPSCIEHAT